MSSKNTKGRVGRKPTAKMRRLHARARKGNTNAAMNFKLKRIRKQLNRIKPETKVLQLQQTGSLRLGHDIADSMYSLVNGPIAQGVEGAADRIGDEIFQTKLEVSGAIVRGDSNAIVRLVLVRDLKATSTNIGSFLDSFYFGSTNNAPHSPNNYDEKHKYNILNCTNLG